MTHQVETTINPQRKESRRFTYDVGYGNPPRDSWFVAGTSGNPRGRPKGSKNKPPQLKDKNLTDILRDELFKRVRLEGDQTEPISTLRAVTQNLITSALGGNVRAAQWVINASRAVEAADAAQQEADYIYAKAYKAKWEDPIRLLYEGLNGPRPIPNPEHVILDDRNRRAMFAGPRNEEEMAQFSAGQDVEEFASEEFDESAKNSSQETGSLEKNIDTDQSADELTASAAEMRASPLPRHRDANPGLEDERLRRA